MESVEMMAGEIESAKKPTNPDGALVGELLGKMADLQTTVSEVVELVAKIQIAETKEEDPETKAEEDPPAEKEEE